MLIAFREMRRSVGRFGLLIGSVALLVLLLLFFQSVAGALTLGITGGIKNNQADVFSYNDSARRNPAASFLPPGIGQQVAAVPGVAEVSEVGRVLAAPVGSTEEATVLGLSNPTLGGPNDLALGRRAEAPGETVISTPSLGGEDYELGQIVTIEGLDLEVVGLATDASFDVSTNFYLLSEDFTRIVAARTGSEASPPVSWVAARVAEGQDPTEVASAITAAVVGIEALDRDEATESLPGAGQITQSFSILYLLLFIVVTIVTGVFFLILTVQKQESLVLLRALGASRGDVVKPVLIEVLAVVGLGSLLGVALASGMLAAAQGVFGQALDPTTTILSVGFILVLGVLSSLGSVRRVLAIDPVEATRPGGD